MFGKIKKKKKDAPANTGAERTGFYSPIGNLSKMLSPAGRIALVTLGNLAREHDLESFVKFMRQPVLAGAAIHAGTVSTRTGDDGGEMNRTQIFEPMGADSGPTPSAEALRHAIYPLVKGPYAASKNRNTFSVGRIEGNDMIMPDYAVSKQHAVIEIVRGTYFIRDCGSTNGTMVNGTRLDKKKVAIKDKDVVGFARYEFTFLLPDSLYKMLQQTPERR